MAVDALWDLSAPKKHSFGTPAAQLTTAEAPSSSRSLGFRLLVVVGYGGPLQQIDSCSDMHPKKTHIG